MKPAVDSFFDKAKKWKAEMELLRSIVLDSGFTEELKWYQPCYTFQGTNVAIISGLKEYCVLSFFKGALLKDAKHILEKPGANTQSARIIKFTNVEQVTKLKPTLKAYLREAIEAEKSGLKVDFKEKTVLVFPKELLAKFKEDPSFEKAFMALTPGRQRAYNLYFCAAKQSATRTARIEKYIPQIMEGRGMME